MSASRGEARAHQPTAALHATHVRSSLVLSSIQSLRARNLFDAYASHLPSAEREAILACAAGVWIPMDVAMAHYRACDALGLTLADQVELGAAVGDRVQGTFLGLLLRAARGAGVTPWIPLSHMGRIWDRVIKGGHAEVVKKGPKDATCRFVGLPVIDVPYLRNAWRGAFLAGMQPFCSKAYVVEIPAERRPGSALYKLSWA